MPPQQTGLHCKMRLIIGGQRRHQTEVHSPAPHQVATALKGELSKPEPELARAQPTASFERKMSPVPEIKGDRSPTHSSLSELPIFAVAASPATRIDYRDLFLGNQLCWAKLHI